MKYITIRCVNTECQEHNHRQTIPAGRAIAPRVTEKLGTLVCDACGHDMWQEPA